MLIGKNSDTVKFNRESRFLIDDDDAETKLSYSLTKPLKVGWLYNDEGVYKFVLTECNSTEDDNHKLGIANYYKYYPKPVTPSGNGIPHHDFDPHSHDKEGVWI